VFGLGATEILVILVIALLVLGPKRLPDAARSLGRGMAEFRRASAELRNAITQPLDEPEPGMRATVPATARHLPDTTELEKEPGHTVAGLETKPEHTVVELEKKPEPAPQKPADPIPAQDA
jgi:TatA/E family protein of Tat protein translocase